MHIHIGVSHHPLWLRRQVSLDEIIAVFENGLDIDAIIMNRLSPDDHIICLQQENSANILKEAGCHVKTYKTDYEAERLNPLLDLSSVVMPHDENHPFHNKICSALDAHSATVEQLRALYEEGINASRKRS
ncbi:MAG: hypothetical protein OEY79_00465 [Anaplasmataceae bacterium]|nr:hypothetical protein [Anaplasmataceae bacterium]